MGTEKKPRAGSWADALLRGRRGQGASRCPRRWRGAPPFHGNVEGHERGRKRAEGPRWSMFPARPDHPIDDPAHETHRRAHSIPQLTPIMQTLWPAGDLISTSRLAKMSDSTENENSPSPPRKGAVQTIDPSKLAKHFEAQSAEIRWDEVWQETGIYRWEANRSREETFVVDTPPPTASGSLHVGHVFSYTQADVMVRYKRMCGMNIFYPMGWDDNGLPTERRVQNYYHIRCDPQYGIRGRARIQRGKCQAAKEAGADGLSPQLHRGLLCADQ